VSGQRDEFENRLGQGLKRWAEAGSPSLNLEAYVTAQAATVKHRRWLRWAVSAAAAVFLLVGATFTFPAWAGTAAAWPVIGPVVQEIIMKDAGLKWAYDAGLIQGTVAEVHRGDVTIRILGVAADRALTTVLYQITGLAERTAAVSEKPVPAGRGLWSSLTHPTDTGPMMHASRVPGTAGVMSSWSPPVSTPMGLYGTLVTNPVGEQGGMMELMAVIDGEQIPITFSVSRNEADKLTREFPIGQTQTFDEITYTIESVIQTPVKTVVKYHVTKPGFRGGYSWSNHEFSMALEAGGEPVYGSMDYGLDTESRYKVFDKTELPARLILPADVKGVPADVSWPLESGAVSEVAGVPVTLKEWEFMGNRLALEFRFPYGPELVAFGELEVLDETGAAHPVKETGSGTGGAPGEFRRQAFELEMPPGIKPVAIRTTQLAVPVPGPWTFDLHQ